MTESRMFDGTTMLANKDNNDLYNAQLVFGLGKSAAGLSMDLGFAEMGNNSAVFGNNDFTVTITSQKAGAIWKVFFDLFENANVD